MRHCGELCRCLKTWEVLSLTKCFRTRVDKCRVIQPTCYHWPSTHVRVWINVKVSPTCYHWPSTHVRVWINVKVSPTCYHDQVLTHTRVNKCRGVSSTSQYLSTRLREHLASDRTCHIFRHLHNSPQCRTLCSDEYFNILDHASTTFNLKSKLSKFNGGNLLLITNLKLSL